MNDRTRMITVRFTPREERAIKAKAHASGVALSTYLRIAGLERDVAAHVREIEQPPAPSVALDRTSIEAALTMTRGHVGAAAIALGCSRRKLQTVMRELGWAPQARGRKPASTDATAIPLTKGL